MARFSFIDDLIMAKPKDMIGIRPDQREMAAAQSFRIDNVDQYLHAHIGDYRSLEDFPNIAPPFANFFMFSEQSHELLEDGRQNGEKWPGIRYGVWFLSSPIESATDKDAISLFASKETNRLILQKAGAKWWTKAVVLEQSSKHAPFVGLALWGTVIKEDGTMMPGYSEWQFPGDVIAAFQRTHKASEDEVTAEMMNKAIMYMAPCALAISLMHCKNVSTADPQEDNRDRYRRQEYERKTGRAAAQWKVLNIRSMQRVLSDDGDIESKGLIHALHICRGHFKDYREKGLFGRNKGIYWWDQHMRGDEAHGVIIKDYAVDAPSPL